MTFEQWLHNKGFDHATLGTGQLATLRAAYQHETTPPPVATVVTQQQPSPAKQEPVANPAAVGFAATMAAIKRETDRQNFIRDETAKMAKRNVGNTAKVDQLEKMCAAAIADEEIDERDYSLALERVSRFDGPIIVAPHQQELTEEVLEAAICKTQRLADVEEKFSDQVLQAAHTRFKRGIGLQEFLMLSAERNSGYRGSHRDIEAVARAAFRPKADHGMYPFGGPSAGPSTITVPGILSNVANKFLAAGFMYGEQSWRQIARIKPANDFKQMTTYRLTGANKFEKVAPGGKIKQGTLSELTYTNQVATYAKRLGISRPDIRNDDLGAFTGAGDELGRGAIDSLNEVFWTEWLNDSAFFNTDKSKNNYDDGATDSVLSLAGLDNADTIFGLQTKPDGTPLGATPTILLVPRALRATALNLMSDASTAAAQSTATLTLKNVWSGMFNVVASVYLQSSAISGYSSTAWWLLADPNNLAAIEVAFLDGQETPIVETSEFDFDELGISMRAFMDWGCSKMEYRAGVKLKGAA